MNMMRNDQQVALQEVLQAVEHSAEHLDDATSFVDEPAISAALAEVSAERRELASELKSWLETLDDLPLGPDPDRDSLEQAWRRLRAWLAPEGLEASFLIQHAEAEQALCEVVEGHRGALVDPDHGGVLDRVMAHAERVRHRLLDWAKELEA